MRPHGTWPRSELSPLDDRHYWQLTVMPCTQSPVQWSVPAPVHN
jgi:hypothetical protein